MSSPSGDRSRVRWNKGATNHAVARPLSPANFPLGSLQSRAAVRAMLAVLSKPIPQADRDCLTIYHNAILVDYGHEPDRTTLQATAAYKRGAELYRQSHGGRESWERDGETNRAELYFKVCRRNFQVIQRREPLPGDVLTFEQFAKAELAVQLFTLDNFRKAWERVIPGLPFPFKMEGSQIFRRVKYNKWCVASGVYSQDEIGTWEKDAPRADITWALVQQAHTGEKHRHSIANPRKTGLEQIVFGDGIVLARSVS
jgi:hypothetical protein